MLTPKDVLYMEDILDQTLVLNKRVVKTCFENVQEKLKEHYQTLLAILESEAK